MSLSGSSVLVAATLLLCACGGGEDAAGADGGGDVSVGGSLDGGMPDAEGSGDVGPAADVAPTADVAAPDAAVDAAAAVDLGADAEPACQPGAAGCRCTAAGRCGFGPGGAPLVCEEDVCVADVACPPGETACECDEGACNAAADVCLDGVCRPDDCAPGSRGCPCAGGDGCDDPADLCVDGACAPAGCPLGTSGCACDAGACDDADDRCVAGTCQRPQCPVGEQGCPCAGGACDPGLACTEAVCVDNTGGPGGPCYGNGTCNPGFDCRANLCLPCAVGALGCICDAGDVCAGAAVCHEGLCVPPGSIGGPPADPLCFTPCDDAIVDDDGAYRACPADGLMAGCPLAGQSCREGSCLGADAPVPTCETDLECPDHQACIDGGCYSNCGGDDDCPGDARCHRKVCRAPCDLNDALCADGYACESIDGSTGLCLPSLGRTGAAQLQTMGTLSVSRPLLELTNQRPTGVFTVVNESAVDRTLTIRRVRHTLYQANGGIEERAGVDGACDAQLECPLTWLTVGVQFDAVPPIEPVEVFVRAGQGVAIEVAGAEGSPGVRWQGVLEVSHPELNPVRVDLVYSQVPDGQWRGTMFYFGRFGDDGLDAWRALPHGAASPPYGANTRDDAAVYRRIRNAFMQVWGGFRVRSLSYARFQAALTGIQTESWAFESTRAACLAANNGNANAACYLFEGSVAGVESFTDDVTTTPIPSGLIDMPVVLNLRTSPDDPRHLVGRINSADTLHYAGNPAVSMRLAVEPTDCSRDALGACLAFFDPAQEEPLAEINVGGRLEVGPGEACPVGFEEVRQPWLIEGFARNTVPDAALGLARRTCRSTQLPFGDPSMASLNRDLAASNPIPDGRPRRRTLRIVDGAFINQEQLFVIFEERFESFLGETDDAGFSAYGFMQLTRSSGAPDEEDADNDGVPDLYAGATPPLAVNEPADDVLEVACPDSLLDRVPALAAMDVDPDRALSVLLDGVDVPLDSACLVEARAGTGQPCLTGGERVHAFCEAEGTFDDAGDGTPCPLGSRVTYFTVEAGFQDPALHPCNDTGTCQATLNQWRTAGRLVQDAPGWTCRDPEASVCAQDRQDLTAERVFFSQDMADAPFAPLAEAISQAFRYKVQFRSRDGASVGFAPQVCLPNSDQIPYCYDPAAIEQLRGRVDCLLALWQSPAYDDLDESVDRNNKARLNNTLAEVFSIGPVPRAANLPASELREGFERLYAELLIMLGDEAFTRAFASRYDIAGGRGAAFPGSRFETGGIDLSGVAGGEMRLLYEAHAYYQEALGRFYSLAPTVWAAVESGAGRRNFVGPELVTEYLERLVRASTQKTRTASAIARRYQGFDRAALARGVIEREFTAAYLESVVLSRMMLGIVQGVPSSARPQIQRFVDASQQRYRAALLDMRNVHRSIRDNVNTFGFAPDYIPFMTVDVRETNAFELAMQRANTRLRLAREREDTAIESDRRFETDAAEFQAELVRIRNTYETQLRDLCGSFEVDGRVLPAVRKYAELDDTLKYLGDPCGFSGLGEIHKALGQIEIAGIEVRRVLQQYENVQAEQDIELAMVEAQCGIIDARAAYATQRGGERVTLERQNRNNQFIINRLQGGLSVAQQFAGAANCLPGACARAFGGAAVYGAVAVGVEIGVGFAEDSINDNEIELIEREIADRTFELGQECAAARVTSDARIDTLELQKSTLILDGLRQEYQARLALAEAQRLFHRAKRLQIEQDEAEALAIDVAAARNDPNIRIYRNDAIINAEVAFDLALKDAYRATLIYEYYTSQSYGQRGDLFLIRLVGRGERNLENYLADLQNAFFEFEESFGLPNTRVMVLSLRDDIFKIPRLDGDGRTIPRDERIQQVRDRLADPRLLDENGYLSIPFSTRLDEVSPATRNHKVRYIEAELNVSEPGDSVARLYLTQNGTSVVRAVDDQQLYYRFPPLTAVINPYFSGAKGVFDADVYRNERARDRPLINTEWRLIINQRDERANQDVNLQSLNDIRLFIYYTDFTRF